MLSLLLLAATCFVAYSNGANDNFKGVASLFGSETVGYRGALAWGTAATFAGSVASFFLAGALLSAFSAKGLVPASVAGEELFLLSVAIGAGGTVLIATLLGFPISTTHSLVGGIVGAGLVGAGGRLDLGMLTSVFLVPLMASPFLALVLAGSMYFLLHRARLSLGAEKNDCICVAEPALAVQIGGHGEPAFRTAVSGIRVIAAPRHVCESGYGGRVWGITWHRLIDQAHFLSAGVVSFARGLNDTPKIAALLVVVEIVDVQGGLVLVGVAIAVGGLLGAAKVAHTMGRKITGMNRGQGLTANVATGLLVIVASRYGVPVSTTHVSVGALFGIGLSTGQANLTMSRNIVLSWIITLPCAILLSALTYWMAASSL